MGFSIITHRTPWIKGEIIENGQVLYDAKNYTLTRCHFRKWVEETDLEMEDMPPRRIHPSLCRHSVDEG